MTDGCDGDAADGGTTDGGWTDAEEEIMLATYRALLEHGYAGLSISRIADELGKSKASIYYHYDSKEDLLGAFLAYAADRFQSSVLTETDDDPREELERVVEKLLPLRPDEEMRQIQAVFLGLRGQAVTNGTFREQFTEIDDRLAATIREIVERGIEEGTFRDVDADRVAEHVLATINGAMYGRATSDRETAVAAVRVSLSSYLDAELRRQS
jgi:AcrR family transcriptional regulator